MLREICERNLRAIEKFGVEYAKLFQDGLAELRDAPTVGDIPNWNNRATSGDQVGQLVFHYGGVIRIEFTANHVRNPIQACGDLDWEKVSSIKILKVEVKNVEKH